MKKKKTILLFVLMSLLAAYVLLYYTGVSPDGEPDTEALIIFPHGWSPRYNYTRGVNLNDPRRDTQWNNFIHCVFSPIHQVDRIIRKDLWLSAKEKQGKIYRTTRPWPLKAPLNIMGAVYVMDGGSISIEGVDQRLTEFRIWLDRSIKTRREKLPQYISINFRQLEYGGSEEKQLAIDLNDWLENSPDDTSEYTRRYVKEVIEAILNRT